MGVTDDQVLTSVLERDVDLVVVQLLQTDFSFREWFVRQVDSGVEVAEFLGISHALSDQTGESDVTFGVVATDSRRHLLLIENKINAAKQERQAERYFERARNHLEVGDWDAYHVCLMAPEDYVSEADLAEFPTVIRYEEMVDQIEELDHDGRPFFLEVFERALEKRSMTDHSALTSAVAKRLVDSLEELPDVETPTVTPTKVEIRSRHPGHPENVFYVVYVPGPYEGDRADVRLEIAGGARATEVENVRTVLASSIDRLDGFEHEPDRIMDAVRTEVWRDSESTEGTRAFVREIAAATRYLLNFYHPRLVESDSVG